MGIFSWRKSSKIGALDAKEMSFLDHLEDLRGHLFRGLIGIGIVAIVLFIYRREVMKEVFLVPLGPDFYSYKVLCQIGEQFCFDGLKVTMQVLSPYEQFMKAMTLSFWGGMIIAFPYLLFELWRFIKPGLKPEESKVARWNVLSMSTLFFIGVSFGYFVILPFSVQFFATFELVEGIENNWRIGDLISFIMLVMVGTGLVFQMPMLVYYLSKLGIIYPEFLRKYRRHAIVILLILAAFITPPDPLSQIIIFLPLSILYEISIFISGRVHKKREKELA